MTGRVAMAAVCLALGVAPASAKTIHIRHHTQGPHGLAERGDVLFIDADNFLPKVLCNRKVKWSLRDGAGKVWQLRRIRPDFGSDYFQGQIYKVVGRVPAEAAPGLGRLRARQRCPNVASATGAIKMRIPDPSQPPAKVSGVRAGDMVGGEGGELRFRISNRAMVEAILEYEIVPEHWIPVATFFERRYYADPGTKKLAWKGRVAGKLPPPGHYRIAVRTRSLSLAEERNGPWSYGEFNIARSIGEPNGTGGDDSLLGPVDVQAAADGRVIVVDNTAKRLVALGPDDAPINSFGTGLQDPLDVAFGSDGSLFVADGSAKQVVRVAPDASVSSLATTASFGRGGPQGIAASVGAGVLYVADGGEVEIIDFTGASNGQIDDAEFQTPRSVAVAPDGSIWVADPAADKLFQFSPAGQRLTVLTDPGEGKPAGIPIGQPRGIDVDRAGTVIYSDSAAANVKLRLPTGTLAFGSGLLGNPGGSPYADGVAAAGLAGDVYVVDRSKGRVLHFRLPR